MSKYTKLIRGHPFGKERFYQTIDKTTDFYINIQKFLNSFPDCFDIDKARGKQLDILGEWIGRDRRLPTPITGVFFTLDDTSLGFNQGSWFGRFDSENGISLLDDDTYRSILKAQISANNWDGTNEKLVELLKIFFGDEHRIFFNDNQDMTMDIGIIGNGPPALLVSFLTIMDVPFKPDGVRINYFVTSDSDKPIFGFDSESTEVNGFDRAVFGKIFKG